MVLGEKHGTNYLPCTLITEDGDILNLKSRLSRLVAISKIFSSDEIGDLELVCAEKEDIERLMNFMMNGNSVNNN